MAVIHEIINGSGQHSALALISPGAPRSMQTGK
jgi:hypothetical protein